METCITIRTEENSSATFICPDCGQLIRKNVSQFLDLDQIIKIKCNCICGCIYSALIERRNNFRKPVNLPGTFTQEGGKETCLLLIKDASRLGLGLKISASYNLKEGENINVEFSLNDRLRSQINRNVVIRKINKFNVHTEFLYKDHPDNYEKFLLYT